MNSAQLQQLLDESGCVKVPAGVHTLETPLFLNGGDITIRGKLDATRCILQPADTAIKIGWRRGLIDDSHYLAENAFRTKADCCLYARGTEFDLGPLTSESGGYRYYELPKLVIDFSGSLAGDRTTWTGVNIAGLNDHKMQGRFPSPWQIYFRDALVLAITTNDGCKRFFRIPATPTAVDLAFSVVIDLSIPSVTATVNGASVSVNSDESGPGWVPGLKLQRNVNAPFFLGKCGSSLTGESGIGDALSDFTIKSFSLSDSAGQFAFYQGGRPGTYSGGPSLPLVNAYTRWGGKFLHAVRHDQNEMDNAGHVRVERIGIHGNYNSPLIEIGTAISGITIDQCRLFNGSRAVATSELFTNYPLTITRSTLEAQRDQHFWLRSSRLVIHDCQLNYAAGSVGTLTESEGRISDHMVSPIQDPPTNGILQRGGRIDYRAIPGDYEGAAGPDAMVTVLPYGDRPTIARLSDVIAGPNFNMLRVLPASPGYSGDVIIDVAKTAPSDGRIIYETRKPFGRLAGGHLFTAAGVSDNVWASEGSTLVFTKTGTGNLAASIGAVICKKLQAIPDRSLAAMGSSFVLRFLCAGGPTFQTDVVPGAITFDWQTTGAGMVEAALYAQVSSEDHDELHEIVYAVDAGGISSYFDGELFDRCACPGVVSWSYPILGGSYGMTAKVFEWQLVPGPLPA